MIASQAVITGAFSVTQQAAQFGYLPRLRIAHTSEERIGQIYVPWINWALLASVLTLVITFKSSAALAFAFGMAVTGTITITTLLFFYIVRHQWHKPLWIVAGSAGALLTVDLLFLAANLTKLVHGAWLPLIIAIAVFTILTTWQKGRELVTAGARRGATAGVHRPAACHEATAAPGAGHRRFPQPRQGHHPLAMRANAEHNQVLHEHVLILSIETMPVPAAWKSMASSTKTTGSCTSPPASATWTNQTCLDYPQLSVGPGESLSKRHRPVGSGTCRGIGSLSDAVTPAARGERELELTAGQGSAGRLSS